MISELVKVRSEFLIGEVSIVLYKLMYTER
jgi:hypothetical protein